MSNKVNFLLIELADIDILSPVKQLNTNYVFIYPAIIHVPSAKNGIADTDIVQIELLGVFKVFLSTNIIMLTIIKDKGIAQILDISANFDMIHWYFICCQQLTAFIRKSQVTYIIHQEFSQVLQNQFFRLISIRTR